MWTERESCATLFAFVALYATVATTVVILVDGDSHIQLSDSSSVFEFPFRQSIPPRRTDVQDTAWASLRQHIGLVLSRYGRISVTHDHDNSYYIKSTEFKRRHSMR